MKKLILLFLFSISLLLNGYNQTQKVSNTLGEMLLADEALTASIRKLNSNAVEDATEQLKYHLSYVIGDRAATIPDFRKVFFSSQCKDAMTIITQEMDNAGLTLELLRIAPGFLASFVYEENFSQKLVTLLTPYHIKQASIEAALPEVLESQARFQSSNHLPIVTYVEAGMLPLLEKCKSVHTGEVAQDEKGPIIHPFTIGIHASQKGYSAGGVVIAVSLSTMIDSVRENDPDQITQAIATLLAVWVNIQEEPK